MITLEELFKQAVRKSWAKSEKLNLWLGQVTAIGTHTCTVKPYKNVRLNATDSDLESYITVYPKIGSNVIVGRLENSDETFLVKTSEIEKISIKINNQTFEMQNSKFKIENQTTNLKQLLNDVLTAFKNATIITPQGNGQLAPQDKIKIQQLQNNINKLFN